MATKPLGLRGHLLASAALFAGLVLLRFQFVQELGVNLPKAITLGLAYGLLDDLVIALTPSALALALWGLFRVPRKVTWYLVAAVLWTLTLANVVYFRYFGDGIEWWAIRHHAADLFVVLRALVPLVGTLPIKIALGLAGVGIVLAVVAAIRRRQSQEESPAGTLGKARIRSVAVGWGAGILAAAFLLVLVTRGGRPVFGSVLNEHVLYGWAKVHFGAGSRVEDEVNQETSATLRAVSVGSKTPTGHSVAWLRDWSPGSTGPANPSHEREVSKTEFGSHTGKTSDTATEAGLASSLGQVRAAGVARSSDTTWPLARHFQATDHETQSLRERLGVPADEAPHIVVLFLETVRAFELLDERLGPMIFPKLRQRLGTQAIHFEQTYSSAIKAGQTVRGQFSTLCSMLPNMNGAATFLTHYNIRVQCLAELAAAQGYQTHWISAQDKDFHNKYLFESLNGTQSFHDYEYFLDHGALKNFENCGVRDRSYFDQLPALLAELADAEPSKPLFVNALNISTHVPHSAIEEGHVPEDLRDSVTDTAYLGYLSRLRYLDESLDAFFEQFFTLPMADNTVFFVLGDHSFWEEPPFALAAHQKVELLHRVPLALIGKNIRPQSVATAVHQVDLAPTVATLGGFKGTVGWMGRGLFGASGTPWVYRAYGQLHYRAGGTACYSVPTENKPQCYKIPPAVDPLLVADLRPVAASRADTELFEQAAYEAGQLIVHNRILPPKAERVAELSGDQR